MSFANASLNPKLSQAAVSLCLVLFAFFAFVLVSDVSKAPAWFERPYSGFLDIAYYQQHTFEPLLVIGLFAVPLCLWHAGDLLANDRDPYETKSRIVSYRPVFLSLILGMLGMAVIQSGFTEWLSCYRPEPVVETEFGSFVFLCTPTPGYLIEFLVLPFLFVLVLLALVKTGSVLREKFS